ncbi:acetolactate synthase 2 catalytic subunit [Ectothiorhodospira marina]|uniref:Acetolactate synthase n=1 Tax=Ectothiorhodospira marina TaxID=1396821 RepID=A0A1H7QLC7_9GAMM|nr:acetolactate synthase 2 catalytic subunit [Ectothiorhodospira marina]SEL48930.1 acetolactate synthase, large subunit [Ectothiorhodospira marina]
MPPSQAANADGAQAPDHPGTPPAAQDDAANGADTVIQILRRQGVETVFGYPGGAIMPLYDALARQPGALKHVLTRHEQAAGFAANGFARSSGQLGVCIATSGPGATNLITAIADAYMDSVPLLVITGQVPTGLMGTDAFQETDVLGLTLPITKHSYLVRRVEDLPAILEEAIHLAQEGRPGPVWVDIPKDVQLAPLPAAKPMAPGEAAIADDVPGLDDMGLAQARALLAEAAQPIIYAGGGVVLAEAVEAFRGFVETTGAPVVTTLKGLGLLAADHPLNMGMLGMHGAPCANRAVQACDLLVVVGARFDDRATGRLADFAPHARVVHLDVDAAEVSKLRPPQVSLLGDLNRLLPALATPLSTEAWRAHCAELRRMGDFRLPPEKGDAFPALRFLRRLSEQADAHTHIACDVGQHQMWVAQFYGFPHPRRHLTSGGLGAMGFGLPVAIGAQMAHPGAQVINISGDGSFMMNVQELATLRRYNLPVKMVIFDNQYLGMVRQQQELFYEGRLAEVDLSDNPDFVQVAQAFGIPALRIEGVDAVDAAIEACLETQGPLLLHIPVAREQNVWPIVGPGMSNDQMIEEDVA